MVDRLTRWRRFRRDDSTWPHRPGAGPSFAFEGNQVRLIGQADPDGGKADVYLDGARQLCGIDCWCPDLRCSNKSSITGTVCRQGKHTLEHRASWARKIHVRPGARQGLCRDDAVVRGAEAQG